MNKSIDKKLNICHEGKAIESIPYPHSYIIPFLETQIQPNLKLLSDPDTQLAECPRCQGLYFFNKTTGEIANAKCNAYACPFCGPKKSYKLRNALSEYLRSFKRIRLATFTVSNRFYPSKDESFGIFSECWRRFINNLRRCQALSSKQRNLSYVRVVELHKSGYPHLHCFVNEFIHREIIQQLWNNACCTVMHRKGKIANVDIRAGASPESAARYVSKYVLKAARQVAGLCRLWSKSAGVSIFKKIPSKHEWIFLNARRHGLYLSILGVSSQTVAEAELSNSVVDIPVDLFCETEYANYVSCIPPPPTTNDDFDETPYW